MIDVSHLSKTFQVKGKEIHALSDITFEVKTGEICGLVGHNGAGKTTLVKILSTLIIPDSGEARVEGHDVVSEANIVRKLLGVMTVSERAFYYRLTGMENLMFFASIRGLSLGESRSRAKELLEMVGLLDWKDIPYMKYSTGMARKLALARALITDPPVILMDEPTLGMDPISSREFRRLVEGLAKRKTVLMTSHNMAEVEDLAQRVVILNRGSVVASGSPQELKERVGTMKLVRTRSPDARLRKFVVGLSDQYFLVRVPEHFNVEGDEVRREPATLEDVFVSLTDEADSTTNRSRGGGGWRRWAS
ncbi:MULTISPECIES: ABC transporter ATP-binding protein [Metallosphaera]|uniref:ABC transporter related protein n=3 Tax=Metallosphaera TaxID=41980 RepID=A4YF40_METS5|nr:ABC transporter related protein [Metallosphaera sedula DSM 5348]AIM27028.1 ABC transporter related protein [Metallosphaera sedula]MCY0861512.1 ABC transporter ATP-binding protein [Metallosphaera prunae]AKV73946.1 multidrug ABC transporter ATP-binding protein [Metallosphaera sedula]AKV76185.1 multidrug ABC transporter ATP-binding protein [Metallosphaera sedula]